MFFKLELISDSLHPKQALFIPVADSFVADLHKVEQTCLRLVRDGLALTEMTLNLPETYMAKMTGNDEMSVTDLPLDGCLTKKHYLSPRLKVDVLHMDKGLPPHVTCYVDFGLKNMRTVHFTSKDVKALLTKKG